MTPLISARLRVPALVAGLLAWIGAIVLGVVFAGDLRAGGFDRTIIRDIHGAVGQRGALARFLVSFTDAPVVFGAIAVLLAVTLVLRRWAVAALTVLGPAVAVGLAEVAFKPLFNRRMLGYLSYPSGHTVAAVTTLTVALLLVLGGASIIGKLIAILIWAGLCLIVMTGLVAMNYHYPTDAIGGFCLALGVILPGAVLADRCGRGLRRSHPIPEPRVGGTGPVVADPPEHPTPQADPAGQAS